MTREEKEKIISECEHMSFDFELFGRLTKALCLDAVKNILKNISESEYISDDNSDSDSEIEPTERMDVLKFIADNAGLSLPEAIELAYVKGYNNAKAEARPKGKWIEGPNCSYRCSNCGEHYFSVQDYIRYKFCPNCGSYNGGNDK